MKKEHLLVIRFSALGDVAMAVPVVYAVALRYPDVRITVLSRPFARTFFENLAPNVNFMAADVKKDYRGVKGLNRLYRRLVAKQFTAVADLHSVLRSDYLRLRFNLGRYRVEHIQKKRNERRKLVAREGKKSMKQLTSPFEKYADVFARLGYPVENITFRSIFEDKGDLGQLPDIIGTKHPDEKWIGVAPFAAHQGKIYPVEKMQQVVAQLCKTYPNARIFLFGRGKDEDTVFLEWVEQMPQCLFVGQYLETMYQELILMSHLDVMLSMDSANMHMASLTSTPVVSVWGATHPMAGFMGWKQSTDNAVQIELTCRPCSIYGQKPCRRGDYQCMNGITPEMIVQKINHVLTNPN